MAVWKSELSSEPQPIFLGKQFIFAYPAQVPDNFPSRDDPSSATHIPYITVTALCKLSETGSHVDQAGLELLILLALYPETGITYMLHHGLVNYHNPNSTYHN